MTNPVKQITCVIQLEVRQDETHHSVNRSKMHCVHRHYQLSVLAKTVQMILSVNITDRNKARSTIRSWAPEATMMFRYIHYMLQEEGME